MPPEFESIADKLNLTEINVADGLSHRRRPLLDRGFAGEFSGREIAIEQSDFADNEQLDNAPAMPIDDGFRR